MPNFAAALKSEITRLARKEARALVTPLRKTNLALRKVIAELKRENARARSDIVKLLRRMPVGVVPRVAEAESTKLRYSAARLAAQRKRLALSAADFGKLIGVTGQSVYSWEQGKSRPRAAQLAAIAAVRGLGKREAGKRLDELEASSRKGRKQPK